MNSNPLRSLAWCSPRRHLVRLLLVACCASLAFSGLPGASAAVALKVTAVKVSGEPQYGSDLLLDVTSNGIDGGGTLLVKHGQTEVLEETLNGTTRVRIPTLNKFQPDTTYTLRLIASTENASGETTVTFTPTKIVSKIGFLKTPISYGEQLGVEVLAANGSALVPTGSMRISADNGPEEIYLVTDGRVRTVPPTFREFVGTHSLRIEYVGDNYFAPAQFTGGFFVNQLTTKVDAQLSTTKVETGQDVSVVAGVVAANPSIAHQPSGTIQFFIAPQNIDDWTSLGAPVQVADGVDVQRNLTDALRSRSKGWWRIKAQSVGNEFYSDSSTSQLLNLAGAHAVTTVTLPHPQRDLETTEFLPVTVTSPTSGVIPTGDVAVIENNGEIGRVRLTDGAGRFPLADLARGSHSLRFYYEGDMTHSPAGTDVTITVRAPAPKASSEVGVTVPDRELDSGEFLPVTVRSNGPAVPTGSVSVSEGSFGHRVIVLDDGELVFPLAGLAPGAHTLRFEYSGDTNTSPSWTTTTVLIRVPDGGDPTRKPTTTPLSLDREEISAGTLVSATATVAVAGGGAGAGEVSFSVDGTVFATQAIASGTASVQVPLSATTSVGTRTVVATFNGSATESASTSNARSFTVISDIPGAQQAPLTRATLVAKARATKARTLKVTASIAAAAPVAGQVRVYAARQGGKKSTMKLIGAGKIVKARTNVKVAVRTKRLKPGLYRLLVKFVGSSTVAPVEKSLKVRIR